MTQIIRISSNPQGLVSAPIGSFFYRRGEKYFLIDGITENETQVFSVNKATFFRKAHNPDFYARCPIEYVSDIETWVKVDDSRGDKFGWQFVAYRPPTFVGEQVVPSSPTPTPTPTTSVMPEPTPTQTPEVTSTPTPTVSSIPVSVENPQFFAIGYASGSGTNFMKSADGINWASRYIDNQGQLNSVAIGNGTLVALEGGTTSTGSVDPTGSFADIHVSTDFGETWTTHHHADFFPTGGHTWADIVYSNGKFVVMSDSGAVVTSNDNGESWTASSDLLGSSLGRADVFGGTTIAQLSNGFYSGSDLETIYHVKLSTDGGATWKGAASESGLNESGWTGICVDDSGFTAISPYNTGSLMYSVNGIEWNKWVDATGSDYPIRGFDIATGHAGYVIAEGGGSSVVWNIGVTTNWEPVEHSGSLPASGDWENITYGNGVYVVVNHNTSSFAAMYSVDGISWTPCNNINNQTTWVDVKHAKVTTPAETGKYFLDVSNYSTLGVIPPYNSSIYYSDAGTTFALDGNVYIWKVEGNIESESLICTNARNLIGKIDTNSETSSIIDITDILARETYGPNTSIVFTTVGDGNSFTADLMTNATLLSRTETVSERFVRQIPYLTVGNIGYPAMLHTYDNSGYTSGNANFANGVEILDFANDGAIIQLSNGYPEDIPHFEYSQDPIIRYTLDISEMNSLGIISTGSSNINYEPNGEITIYERIYIWRITGSMTSDSSSFISSNDRELVVEIDPRNYLGTSSIDITSIVMNAEVNVPNTALVFTTFGNCNSKLWDLMTSASLVDITGSTELITVRSIPYMTENNSDQPYMVAIQNFDGENYTTIGDVGFAGGVMFPNEYSSFAKIVLHNGYPVPPTYIEFSQNQPTPTPTPTLIPETPEPTPTPTPTPAVPPINDNFDNATEVFGMSGLITSSNVGSTAEANDPANITETSTIWWKWTPPMIGTLPATVSTIGSELDTILYVYHLTGSAVTQSNLEFIIRDDDIGGSGTSLATFAITGSDTYYFAVAGYNSSVGNITLNYSTI
jgi:hypothetical protein